MNNRKKKMIFTIIQVPVCVCDREREREPDCGLLT